MRYIGPRHRTTKLRLTPGLMGPRKADPEIRARAINRLGRRAQRLRLRGDDHGRKMAVKLLRRIANG